LVAAGPDSDVLTAEVRDNGNFFKPETIKEADDIIKEIKQKYKHDLLIETYATVPEKDVEKVEKMNAEERNKYFNEWAIARARTAEVNGVYILICKKPPHLEVEVGNETRKKAFTVDNRRELRDLLVKYFEEQKYDQGLLEAVRYVQRTMGNNLKAEAPIEKKGEKGGFMSSIGGWLCMAVVIGLVIWVVI